MTPRTKKNLSYTITEYAEAAIAVTLGRYPGASERETVDIAYVMLKKAGLGKGKRTIRRHLSKMKQAGVLRFEKHGRYVFHHLKPKIRLKDPGKRKTKMEDVMNHYFEMERSPERMKAWESVKRILRKISVMLPEVTVYGVFVPSKVRPRRRVDDSCESNILKELDQEIVSEFLFLQPHPSELVKRFFKQVVAFHSLLDDFPVEEVLEEVQNLPSNAILRKDRELVLSLAIHQCRNERNIVEAVLDNIGIDKEDSRSKGLKDWLQRAAERAEIASRWLNKCEKALTKLENSLEYHSGLFEPLTIEQISRE